jgi:polyhydroxyalkanoate synthase
MMKEDRPKEQGDGRLAPDARIRHRQFGLLDAVRCMQGNMLASLGFGPIETGYRVIASGPHWRLRDYGTADTCRCILIVAAPIKRPYIWDLAPAVSAVRRCVEAGLRVYLLEWLPASEETCNAGLVECVQAISSALQTINSKSENCDPILMGHSLGGTLAAIHAAAAPASLAGLVLLGSPLCFPAGENKFRDALIALVPAPISDSGPYPGSLLSHASAAASPETFIWSRYMDAVLSIADCAGMEIHARVERWALDEVALPGKLVRDIVELLYRENRFCRGTLNIDGQTIRLEDLSVPTLAIVNVADPVAPLHSVSPIGELLGPERAHVIEYSGESGVCLQHVGMLVGRRAHAQVWPKIIEWIRLHDQRGSKLCA